MITLKQFLEAANYRITEGSDYGWQCFGPRAYCLDSWNGEQNGHTLSVVFDTNTQVVYQVTAYDYQRDRAYRMINPEFKKAFDDESKDRDAVDMAWERDDGTPVEYTDLEVEEDFLEKATAIAQGQDYDTCISIPLNFSDEELLRYMIVAHERDITFNQLVVEAIQAMADKVLK